MKKLYQIIAPVAMAAMAYCPTSSAGPVKNVFKGLGKTVTSATFGTIAKVGKNTIKRLNPVRGVVDSAFDTTEELSYAVRGKDSGRDPVVEDGRAVEYIREDHPLLGKAIDTVVAAGSANWVGQGGNSTLQHIRQATGYVGGAQAAIGLADINIKYSRQGSRMSRLK